MLTKGVQCVEKIRNVQTETNREQNVEEESFYVGINGNGLETAGGYKQIKSQYWMISQQTSATWDFCAVDFI